MNLCCRCYNVAHEENLSPRTPHPHFGVGTRGFRRRRYRDRTPWRAGCGAAAHKLFTAYACRQESADLRLHAENVGSNAAGQRQHEDPGRGSEPLARVYFDTSYIAKFYFNEPESPRVRELVRKADAIYSSLWALAEFHAVLHRRVREGASTRRAARELALRFSQHIEDGLWNLVRSPRSLHTHRRRGPSDDGARTRRTRCVDQ